MIVEHGVPMPTADGCRLLADVYRPDTDHPVPAVLERTPYGRGRCDQAEVPPGGQVPRSREQLGQAVTARGLAFVVQACRGTDGSGGDFEKYLHEADDGVQAIAWLAGRSWCDGRVATMGFSYAAMTQLAPATLGAPALVTCFLDSGGFFDAHGSGLRRGGAFEIKQATWAVTHAVRTARSLGLAALAESLAAVDVEAWLRRTPWDIGRSPISALPTQERQLVAYWRTEAAGRRGEDGDGGAASPGGLWRHPALHARGGIATIASVPVMVLTSWFDTSLPSSLALWCALQAEGSDAARRSPLIIGPWTHGNRHQPWAGDLDFGDAAGADAAFGSELLTARLDWIDEALGRRPRRLRPPVSLFVMGGGAGDFDARGRRRHGGAWLEASTWPPAAAREEAWHLHEAGVLEPRPSPRGAATSFTADPFRPVPTRGGAINGGEPLMQGGAFAHVGPVDGVHVRRFDSAPLAAPRVVAGPLRARLWVSTDAPDADVVVRLFDVYPDGVAYGLADGILRLSHRDPLDAPRAMTPGEVAAVEVELDPTANRFERGHRIRVEIAGSNFPRFDLNPHVDPAARHMDRARVATTTLHLGGDRPSQLLLHLLPPPAWPVPAPR